MGTEGYTDLEVEDGKLTLSNNGPSFLYVEPGELHLSNNGPPVLDVEPGKISLRAKSGAPVLQIDTQYSEWGEPVDFPAGKLRYSSSLTGAPVLEVTDSSLTFFKPGGTEIAFQVDADGNIKAGGEILSNYETPPETPPDGWVSDRREKRRRAEEDPPRAVDEHQPLADEIAALHTKIGRLEAKNGALDAKNGALEEKMAVIEAKFAALEAKLTAA
jgi:hypothetical protein